MISYLHNDISEETFIQRKLFLIFVKLGLNGKEVLCLPGAASRTRTYARRSYPSCFGALVAKIIAKGKLQPNVPSDTPISIISKDKLYTEANLYPSLHFNAEGVAIFGLLNFLRIHGYCAFQVDPVPASVSFSGEGFVLQLRQVGPFTIFISLGAVPMSIGIFFHCTVGFGTSPISIRSGPLEFVSLLALGSSQQPLLGSKA